MADVRLVVRDALGTWTVELDGPVLTIERCTGYDIAPPGGDLRRDHASNSHISDGFRLDDTGSRGGGLAVAVRSGRGWTGAGRYVGA